MAILDNEMLDRALDAAEEKLAAQESENTPQEAPAEAAKPDVVEEAIVAQKIQETQKAQSGRDKSGKFTPKAAKSPVEQAKEVAAEVAPEPIQSDQEADVEQVEAPVVESIDPPTFWSAEHKALFAKAPADVQKAIVQYEAQRNEFANRKAAEAERGKYIEKRVSEVFKPYELKLKANGVKDPLEAAERLLAWNEMFEKDPRTAISELMHRNGLSPNDFIGDEAEQAAKDPRVDELQQHIEEQKRAFEEYKASIEQQQSERAILSEVEAFKQGKDSTGQVRKPFAEMYAPQISQALNAIYDQYPQLSLTEALNHAYEYVAAEVKKLSGVTAPAPKPAVSQEQIIANAQKAKGAVSSVSGAPKNGAAPVRPRAKSIDEALDRAEEVVYGGR